MQWRLVADQLIYGLMEKGKARLTPTLMENFFCKHRQRPHPRAEIAVKRAVDNVGLERFAVLRHAEHLVEIAFEMPIDARAQIHTRKPNQRRPNCLSIDCK